MFTLMSSFGQPTIIHPIHQSSSVSRQSENPLSFTIPAAAPTLVFHNHRRTWIRSTKGHKTLDFKPRVYANGDSKDQDKVLSTDAFWAGEDAVKEAGDNNYDKDPEFSDILGTCLDDPEKAQSKIEERLSKKRNKILQTKTGSAKPMKVKFNKFDFSNSYIWFELYNIPLEKDIKLITDAIRSWHIIGRLGGCNSMNMQLSQSPLDKRPVYDAIQGANVNPTTFYNIGDFEIQDNLARIWVDIGTAEPLMLDILINALIQISSDYVGIKQVVFGGLEFESWSEELKSEVTGYTLHKI